MHHFALKEGVLHAENVSLETIAAEVGTPTYVYSTATLERHYRVFEQAFAGGPCLIAYSVKANSNTAVIATLARLGAGADIVSEGELRKALAAGVPPEKVVFSGVGKKPSELAAAVEAGIGLFNVESLPELEALSAIAESRGARAPVAVRVNPDVSAGGHAKISTGKRQDKFGVAWDDAESVYAKALALPGVEVVGVDVHIGSQIEDLAPIAAAVERVAELVVRLQAMGCAITRVDIGGGLGIPYRADAEAPPEPAAYAAVARRALDPLGVEIIVEPGRLIAGNAGLLLTRVIYVKEAGEKTFVILDAAMNDLIRPALYDAWHELRPVREPDAGAPWREVDFVGPVCESSDIFARGRAFPPIQAGDLIAVMSAGAYGAVQASEYNSRPRAAEALVHDGAYAVVRPRPTYESMQAMEATPAWLADAAG